MRPSPTNSLLAALVVALALTPTAAARDPRPRPPGRPVCPTCERQTKWILVEYSRHEDQTLRSFHDLCGFGHYHDASYQLWALDCRVCEKRFVVRRDAPGCACGWTASDPAWSDPCEGLVPEEIEEEPAEEPER